MKLKFAVMLAPALALGVLAVSAEAQQHKATRLGNPATRFAKKPPTKADDIRVLLRSDQMKADVAAILNEMGWKGKLEDFDRAVASAEISEIQTAPGTRLPFMASRTKGRAHALVDLLWAGWKPIDAFAFEMDSNCVRYRVVTPKACGNFWMEEKPSTKKTEAVMGPAVGVTAGDVCITQPVHVKITTANAAADGTVQFTLDGQTESMPASAMTEKDLAAYAQPGSHTITVAMQGASPATATFNVKPCPPVCAIAVAPAEIKRKKPFTVDTSASQMAAGVTGSIKSATVEISLDGAVVDTFELAAPNMKRDDVKVKKAGMYTVKATVTDEAGQKSTNTCEASFEVPKPKNPFFIAALFGKERLFQDDGEDYGVGGRCAGEMGIKAGILPEIAEDLELELSIGAKIDFRDGNNSSMFADVALNKIVGRGFLGGGVSFWDLTESDTRAVALLLQGGFDLSEDGMFQFLGEARAPFNQFDNLENNYQFWGGIRIRPWR